MFLEEKETMGPKSHWQSDQGSDATARARVPATLGSSLVGQSMTNTQYLGTNCPHNMTARGGALIRALVLPWCSPSCCYGPWRALRDLLLELCGLSYCGFQDQRILRRLQMKSWLRQALRLEHCVAGRCECCQGQRCSLLNCSTPYCGSQRQKL